jgi:cellulose synthase/poly-beta-1,6-N-acetylglucosamine synthase-like glycosyltransferase
VITPVALIVLAIGAGFIVYVLFVYPLLLAAVGRLRPLTVIRRPEMRSVSILLPVRNGEAWIRRKLESILALNYVRSLMQIIVISDGSDDRTDEIVKEFAAAGVELLRVPKAGKAAALNAAMPFASGEIVFFTDVRQRLDANALRYLVESFSDPSVGMATGELIITAGDTEEERGAGLYWLYEKWIRRQMNRARSLVVVTGCLYAMRRALVVPIPPDILVDDAYLPISVLLRGYRIYFEERARAYDFPTSLQTEFRRKVRTLAGLYQIAGHFPRLLLPWRAAAFHFLSYKFSRLFLPYALIAIAIASFVLPFPWNALLLSVQALFYALAALDFWIEESACKRITSPVRTFVVLMAASLCAASVFIIPSHRLWGVTHVRISE